MKYNPALHDRRSIRLHGYDYAATGAYFVTICLNRRVPKKMRVAQGKQGVAQGQTHRSAPTGMTGMAGMTGMTGMTGMAVGAGLEFDFPTFGVVENGVMVLNDSGKMVEKYILEIVNNTDKFFNIKINEYVIMPDHIHAIIIINEPYKNNPAPVGADLCVCPIAQPAHTIAQPVHTVELGTIIQWFKTMTTNEYTNSVKGFKWKPFYRKLWQRNYYERIIRDEAEYARIAEYIHNNPILWEKEF